MNTLQKLWQMLTREYRRSALVLLGLMLVGMVLEAFGISLVIPALALMMQADLATKYPALAPILGSLGNPSHERLVLVGMMVLVGAYVVKVIFLVFLTWRQTHFVYGLQANLAQRLFAGYLRQPYSFHLQRNSAQLINNIYGLVGKAMTTIQQVLLLLAESFALIGILAILMIVEPLGTVIVVSIFGSFGWGFNRFTRNHNLYWGKAFLRHDRSRIQHLQEGLGGVKDIKLLGRESGFLEKFWRHNSSHAQAGRKHAIMSALPRLWMELLAVIGLASLVLTIIAQGKPMDELLPTLGLFAAAAFRLMPSSNRVLTAIQEIRFSSPIINELNSELNMLGTVAAPNEASPLDFKQGLALEHLDFRYPSSNMPALQDINMIIPYGSSIGFIGGSGAGKSTLVDVILGLLTPCGGSVRVDGVDIQENLRGWQDQIGYVPQSIFLSDDTLRRNIAFGLPDEQIDEAAIQRVVHAAQMEKFVNELPQGLDTLVGERGVRLSGGQRQRIGIARALYHDPSVLVLDEATSSLDIDTERDVMEVVRALQSVKMLIIVAHRLSTVRQCDRIYRIEGGRVIEEGKAITILGEKAGIA